MTTDLGKYGGDEEPPYAPPVVRPHRGLSRRHLVVVPLVLLLVEGVFLGERLHARHGRDADPARVAAAFLTAVQRDRAAAAAALTRLPADIDARFTQEDLGAQGGIAQPEVTRTVRRGGEATVTVAYTVGGFVVHSDFVLARRYEGFLHAPTWRIVGGLPVVHVRGAPFETTAQVNGRLVALHHGTADVTVLPGVVQVNLAAFPPAAATTNTVAATGDGTVVRFPAILDTDHEQQLEGSIDDAITRNRGRAFPYFLGSDLDITLSDDAQTVTFSGRLHSFLPQPDPVTGLARSVPGPAVAGTATYAAGQFTVTALHVG